MTVLRAIALGLAAAGGVFLGAIAAQLAAGAAELGDCAEPCIIAHMEDLP